MPVLRGPAFLCLQPTEKNVQSNTIQSSVFPSVILPLPVKQIFLKFAVTFFSREAYYSQQHRKTILTWLLHDGPRLQ